MRIFVTTTDGKSDEVYLADTPEELAQVQEDLVSSCDDRTNYYEVTSLENIHPYVLYKIVSAIKDRYRFCFDEEVLQDILKNPV